MGRIANRAINPAPFPKHVGYEHDVTEIKLKVMTSSYQTVSNVDRAFVEGKTGSWRKRLGSSATIWSRRMTISHRLYANVRELRPW